MSSALGLCFSCNGQTCGAGVGDRHVALIVHSIPVGLEIIPYTDRHFPVESLILASEEAQAVNTGTKVPSLCP